MRPIHMKGGEGGAEMGIMIKAQEVYIQCVGCCVGLKLSLNANRTLFLAQR